MNEMMEKALKGWKMIILAFWMILITVMVFKVNSKLNWLERSDQKVRATIGSIESLVITTENNISSMENRMETMESDVSYVVQKVRRR